MTNLDTDKKEELLKIVSLITSSVDTEKIVLFGSYARGDWVSDSYKEGDVTYEYLSDYDILVVVKSEKLQNNSGLWNDLGAKIRKDLSIRTPVSLVVDNIHFVNQKLHEGNYFYSDIVKEGVVLFDSGNFNFASPQILTISEQRERAEREFEFWYGRAASFKKDFEHNMQDKEYANAAFHMHQVVEALLVTVLLVYTGYKPKTHDIEKIYNMVFDLVPNMKDPFDRETEAGRKRFDLLKRAYVDARYSKDYIIDKESLLALANEVNDLDVQVNKISSDFIATLK